MIIPKMLYGTLDHLALPRPPIWPYNQDVLVRRIRESHGDILEYREHDLIPWAWSVLRCIASWTLTVG